MCPKGVLLEDPYMGPQLHEASYNWAEVLRQYICATTGLSRATFGPTHRQPAFLPKCEYVLQLLKRQKFADAFLEPVDLTMYKDYTDFVSEPIDLDAIQHKVDDFAYASVDDFVQDVRRVGFNALMYNAAGSKVADMAHRFLAWFESVAMLLDMWQPPAAVLLDTNPRNGNFSPVLDLSLIHI